MLVIHIIAVAAWLGANLLQAFASPLAAGADPVARRWWADAQGRLSKVYYSAAGVVILLTGVFLVIDGDFKFSTAFVSIGFLAIIVGILLGIFGFGPGTREIVAAIDSGDEATEKSVTNRLAALGIIDTLVVVLAIVAMVGHWGVG